MTVVLLEVLGHQGLMSDYNKPYLSKYQNLLSIKGINLKQIHGHFIILQKKLLKYTPGSLSTGSRKWAEFLNNALNSSSERELKPHRYIVSFSNL